MPPSHAQVLDIPAVGGPIEVTAEMVDANGHMNIRRYFDLCTASATAVFRDVGLSFDNTATRGSGLFSMAQHLEYHAECGLGDELSTRTVLLHRTSHVLHGQTYLVNETRRVVSHTSEFVSLHVDLRTRRPADFHPDSAAALDRHLALPGRLRWVPQAPGRLFRTEA